MIQENVANASCRKSGRREDYRTVQCSSLVDFVTVNLLYRAIINQSCDRKSFDNKPQNFYYKYSTLQIKRSDSMRQETQDQQDTLHSDKKRRASRKRSQDDMLTKSLIRDCTSLYASPITVQCARIHKCIPCGYKIGLFDVSLDSDFTKSVPNARPEQCPRSSVKNMPSGTMNFLVGMSVFTNCLRCG